MKKIEKFMLPEHTNSLYENEAISSISLTREVADKINEIVDSINQLYQVDLEWKQVQEGTIRKGVLFMKDNLVNSLNELMQVLSDGGFVENRISYITEVLTNRVDNLLEQLNQGNTGVDAEILDGRVGADGVTYTTLGKAIRDQLTQLNDILGKAFLAKGYANYFNGEAVTGWAMQDEFVVRDGFVRTAPIFLTPGTYVANTSITTFTVGVGELVARVNTNGDFWYTIKGVTNDVHANANRVLVEIVDSGYYCFNIGRDARIADFMVCKCNSFEEFPREYIPHSTVRIEDGVSLNTAMIEQVEEVVNGANNYTLERNVLYGKKAVFDGDSICEGDSQSGWAGRIGEKNHMRWVNAGKSGGTITQGVLTSGGATRHSVATNLDNIIANHSDLEYLILEGGTNDADLIPSKLGRISPDKCLHTDFDPSADFTQALEYTLSKAIATFPTKRIGFIVAHKMASANGYKDSNRRLFFDRCVEVCKKYGIPCLDLWNTSHLWGVIDKASHNGNYYMYTDGQHLSSAGYDYISDIVEAWMKTI